MVDLNNVYTALSLACSQNSQDVKNAEEALARLSVQAGFYPILADCFMVPSSSNNAAMQWQAALYLKNKIDAIWRKSHIKHLVFATQSDMIDLSDNEKGLVRSKLLQNFEPGLELLDVQKAIIISKIARIDFPNQWPELFPTILTGLEATGSLNIGTHTVLLRILYYVVKQLASKRLATDKRRFKELTLTFLSPMSTLCNVHLEACRKNFSKEEMRCVNFCLKVVRYMLIYGLVDQHHEIAQAKQFLDTVPALFDAIMALRTGLTDDGSIKICDKSLALLLKLLTELQDLHSNSFVQWMPEVLTLTYDVAFGARRTVAHADLKVKAINLIKGILLCQEYKLGSLDATGCPEITQRALELKAEFFSAERCVNLVSALQQYIVMDQADLESWSTDPEAFAAADYSEAWRYQLRPAAEVLFVTILHEYLDYFTSLATQWAQECYAPLDYQNHTAVLTRDALYTALGLAAQEFFDLINFDEFFSMVILPQLAAADQQSQAILQRRLLWLAGRMLTVRLSVSLRPLLYQTILSHMAPAHNIVVRLQAVRTLHTAVDDFEFKTEDFLPYLGPLVTSIIGVLRDCSEGDSHFHLIECLSMITERCGSYMKTHLTPLYDLLPDLWKSEHNQLKASILALFGNLVKGLGAECVELFGGLTQLLRIAVDMEQPAYVYLLEDGLQVWLWSLENAPSPLDSNLLGLFPYILRLLPSVDTAYLKQCFEIIKAYVLYCSEDFEKAYLESLAQLLASMLSTTLPENSQCTMAILKCIEMVLKCSPQRGAQVCTPVILWCIRTVLRTPDEKTSAVVVTLCTSVVSLLTLREPEAVYRACELVATELNIPIGQYLVVWIQKAPCLTHDLERRKLNGLAMAQWLISPSEVVAEHFAGLCGCLIEIMQDVCVEEDGQLTDALLTYDFGPVIVGGGEGAALDLSCHDKRMQVLRDSDVVYTESIVEYVGRCVKLAEERWRPERFGQLWTELDVEVRDQITAFCFVKT